MFSLVNNFLLFILFLGLLNLNEDYNPLKNAIDIYHNSFAPFFEYQVSAHWINSSTKQAIHIHN